MVKEKAGREGRKRKGRPPLYGEKLTLTNFRLPREMLEDLEDAFHALGKPSVSDLVRDALRKYLDDNTAVIESYRRHRKKHQ